MSERGKVITFYSYKGGTGRTMALANVACLLSQDSEKSSGRVLMLDFDLEAPGLHHFFTKVSTNVEELAPGIMNYFRLLKNRFDENEELYQQAVKEGWNLLEKEAPIKPYIISDVLPGLDFIKAGSFDDEYPELINSFDWQKFYSQYGDSISIVRQYLESRYQFILVDSRTGLTDISGICTMLLPEKLVGVFTPNRQSLQGLLQLIKQAVEYRQASNDFRPLAVFPLPSRVDQDEPIRRLEWRKKYQHDFEELFKDVYGIEQCDLGKYFDEVMLQHVKYYAYGEEIAVLTEPADSVSLSRAYRKFSERLIGYDFAWQGAEMEKKRPVVFLSYARRDKEIAAKLSHDLRNAGLEPWLDTEKILAGQN